MTRLSRACRDKFRRRGAGQLIASQGKDFHRHKALPMSTETKQRGIAEKSADTITIEHRLRKLSVDEIVTYDELSTLLGRDVRTHCSGNMQTARKELEKDALFFGTVRGKGIVRLSNDGAVESSKSHLVRARRATTRGLRKLACVPFEQLSDKAKKSHLVTSAQLGAMNLFAKSSSARKIEQKTNGSEQPVPIGETLKLFGG